MRQLKLFAKNANDLVVPESSFVTKSKKVKPRKNVTRN